MIQSWIALCCKKKKSRVEEYKVLYDSTASIDRAGEVQEDTIIEIGEQGGTGEIEDCQKMLIDVISRSGIDKKLSEAKELVVSTIPDNLYIKISKEIDPLELYFQIGDDVDKKEKFHKFISSYTAPYEPKEYVLKNCMLTSEERLKTNSALEKYTTIVRKRIGDTYYMINHAVFKKVMMFNQKESLCIKAFKFIDNGDCIEQNISIIHDRIPISIDRITVVDNPIYYQKVENGKLIVKSYNHVIPKTNMGMMVLKPIMNSSYNTTFKMILKILEEKKSMSVIDMEKAFI